MGIDCCVTRMKTLRILSFIAVLGVTLSEDYDFANYEDGSLNSTVKLRMEETMDETVVSFSEAIEMMKIRQEANLRAIIEDKERMIEEKEQEKQTLLELWDEEKRNMLETCEGEKQNMIVTHEGLYKTMEEKCAAEKGTLLQTWEAEKHVWKEEKARLVGEMNNKRIQVNFLSRVLVNNDNQLNASRELVKAQNEKITMLAEEREQCLETNNVHMRQNIHQTESIKLLSKQKQDLIEIIRIEKGLGENYHNLTLSLENREYYVQMMAKTLSDQTEDLNKLRSYLDDENKIETYLEEIPESMDKINVTIAENTAEWDLHSRLMSLIQVQAESLENLKPSISYFVNNNRNLRYQEIDGNLIASSICQCIPQVEDSNITISGVESTCPSEMVVHDTGETTGISSCLHGMCPRTINKTVCTDRIECTWSDWSAWRNCTWNFTDGHGSRSRTRTVARNGFGRGHECVEEEGKETESCVDISSFYLTSDSANQYYKLPVPHGVRMEEGAVSTVCHTYSMKPVCHTNDIGHREYKYNVEGCLHTPTERRRPTEDITRAICGHTRP